MENPVTEQRVRHRRRIPRNLTRRERLQKFLEMPHLTRRDRNQRVAVVGLILLATAYLFVLRPLFDMLSRSKPQQGPAFVPVNPGKKK